MRIDCTSELKYVTPFRIPDGPTLFVLDSSSFGGAGQVVAVASNAALVPRRKSTRKEDFGMTQTSNLISKLAFPQRSKVPIKTIAGNQDVNESVGTREIRTLHRSVSVGKTKERTVYICELCREAGGSVQFNQFCTLSKHCQQAHNKLLKEGSVRCREENCNFQVQFQLCLIFF